MGGFGKGASFFGCSGGRWADSALKSVGVAEMGDIFGVIRPLSARGGEEVSCLRAGGTLSRERRGAERGRWRGGDGGRALYSAELACSFGRGRLIRGGFY